MPRIRQDNDARYALRASFVDENGAVLTGDTIAVAQVTATDISNWNTAYGWGDHSAAGYLTSFTETDPTVPAHVKSITTTEKSNWNTAYGWGDHASAGYAASSSVGGGAQYIDTVRGQYGSVDVDNTTNSWAGYGVNGNVVFMEYAGTNEWGIYNDIDNEWYINGYRNDRVDIMHNGTWRVRTTSSGMTVNGTISASGYNNSNWDTAYSWGNHASAGYLVEGTTITSGIGSTTAWTAATKFKSAGDISQAAGGHSLSCYSDVGNDAFMSFHVGGDYAIHFGLENATNRLYYGGWSHGTGNKYQLWSTQDFNGTQVNNWNTAYSWGNHATQGYTTYNGSDAVKTTYNSSLNSDSRNSRGVTRLYRRDDNSDYSVQHYWTGAHWYLQGYSGDTYHAQCRVGYADVAGSASSASSATTSSQVTINYNNNSNSGYQMLWGSGNYVYGTAGITCNPYYNIIYSSQIVCSDWVRTTGNTGWYNNTYGGGLYMEDTTWVRVASSKQFYNSNTGGNSIATPGDVVAGYSDIRLKDVEEVENDALTKIKGWDSIYYRDNEKARELGYEGSERKFGLVAQQVQETLPEVIKRAPVDMDADGGSLSGEDYITVDYERVVPMLVAGIKELTAELDEVKQALKELRDGSTD